MPMRYNMGERGRTLSAHVQESEIASFPRFRPHGSRNEAFVCVLVPRRTNLPLFCRCVESTHTHNSGCYPPSPTWPPLRVPPRSASPHSAHACRPTLLAYPRHAPASASLLPRHMRILRARAELVGFSHSVRSTTLRSCVRFRAERLRSRTTQSRACRNRLLHRVRVALGLCRHPRIPLPLSTESVH